MRGIVDEKCSMIDGPCRHCSIEHTFRHYTRIEKDIKTGLFKPMGMGRKKVELGEFCNDAGKFVADMHWCPLVWDRMRNGGFYGRNKTKKN